MRRLPNPIRQAVAESRRILRVSVRVLIYLRDAERVSEDNHTSLSPDDRKYVNR